MFTVIHIAQLSVLLLLIALSLFFSLAETSLTSVNVGRICRLKAAGNKKAGKILDILSNKDGFLRAVLCSSTAANIFSASIASSMAIEIYGDDSLVYVSLVLTLVILLICEIFPKTYAVRNPERVALFIAYFVDLLIKVMTPFTYFIDIIVNVTQKFLKLDEVKETSNIADDIKSLVAMHISQDVRKHYDLKMLGNITELQNTAVSHAMTHRSSVYMINIDDEMEVIIEKIFNCTFSRIPVCCGNYDNVVGILYIKKLAKVALKTSSITKEDIMNSCFDPWYIPNTISLRDQLLEFRRRKMHFAVVINEYSVFQGVITLEDIIEQIVGAIYDEHDIEKSMLMKVSDNEYVVDTACYIRNLNTDLDINLPQDVASTLGGLVLFVAGRLPDIGEVFQFGQTAIKILAIQDKKVSLAQIIKNVEHSA